MKPLHFVSVLAMISIGGFAYAESDPIPSWIKNTTELWLSGQVDDETFKVVIEWFIMEGLVEDNYNGEPITSYTIPTSLFDDLHKGMYSDEVFKDTIQRLVTGGFMEATQINRGDPYPSQYDNNEIRFSGYRGELINCETFSYEVSISINSKTPELVMIEIIDPRGNVAGSDEFNTEHYRSPRVIEMDWGVDGRYKIHVHYKGETYQEDFSHNKLSTETFRDYRMNCLESVYVEFARNQTIGWFNSLTEFRHDGFEKNIRIADKLVRESDSRHLKNITSEGNVGQIALSKKRVHDLERISSVVPELKSLLQDKIEQKVISVFQESENKLIENENVTIDEKTELVFELRQIKEQQIATQKTYAEKYVDSLYKIYRNAKITQDRIDKLEKLQDERAMQEREKELQIELEKESIKQQILAKNLLAADGLASAESAAPPYKQLRDGTPMEMIACADGKVLLQKSGRPACLDEESAQKLLQRGWEPVVRADPDDGRPVQEVTGIVVLEASSPVEFVDDGREYPRALQRHPPPAPWDWMIKSLVIAPGDVGSDNRIRLPTMPHEKYSVTPGTGFHVEDWMPSHIPDGQRLLYAESHCYPSGDCFLKLQFAPTTFVLSDDTTNYDMKYKSKGFEVWARYSTVQLDEIEDKIEHIKEIFGSQPGNYGEGFRDMTRDGKTVSAFEGGNDVNRYRAVLHFHHDEHTTVGVVSSYHTLDELLPVFDSILQ